MSGNNSLTKQRAAELKELYDLNGKLYPKDVVERAKDESSSLHSYFEWDDEAAAHQHRLSQARTLITLVVDIMEVDAKIVEVPVYMSKKEDRIAKGGYTETKMLLKTQTGREKILETALWELEAFERRYAAFSELTDVFVASKAFRKALKGT